MLKTPRWVPSITPDSGTGNTLLRDIKFPFLPCTIKAVEPGLWRFELLEDFWIQYQNYIYFKPKGWVFDLASSPRLFWSIISPIDLGILSVFIHDVLCEHQGYVDFEHIIPIEYYYDLQGNKKLIKSGKIKTDSEHNKRHNPLYYRVRKLKTERIFLDVMLMESVPRLKAHLAYWTIRFAKPYWDDEKKSWLEGFCMNLRRLRQVWSTKLKALFRIGPNNPKGQEYK